MNIQNQWATLMTCLCLMAGAPGCDPDPHGSNQGLAADGFRNYDYAQDCPRWQCGYNTADVNGKSMQELNLDGLPNADGVAVVGVTVPAGLLGLNLLPAELGVVGDALAAFTSPNGAPLTGAELVGAVLWLEVDGLPALPVTISGYEQVESWAEGSPPVDAYALTYVDVEGALSLERSVCKGTLVDPLQAAVVILAGERYDPETKAVLPDEDRWITLACAGSATAKVALLGYGPHGELGGQGAASVEQRQATLNMITANYCGDGHAYTEDGTPLAWEDAAGVVTPFMPPGAREALWDADGALCLDTPRLVERTEVGCELPTCAELEAGGELDGLAVWLTHGEEQG
ncbi:hypothetical protein PPSIR1_23076 [Plesiocystis pacifica SIR-1]|uniref:ADYC domain-containing protein n=1 Tax=Plesiocystis pacifica SIR-1 TaxID=391625 RepID=A6G2N8_9BACT|nr:ADYC domain-containing protein [Plesiocystis pacifica]EDM79975.1 hypothetical protein PPSIR1_23076 [Plesiocystis pacifica SIR-1]